MKTAILGFGVEGQVSAEYWAQLGADITICDENVDLKVPSGWSAQLGSTWLDNLDQYDVLVRTPALRPDRIADANAGTDLTAKTTSGLREFMAKCPAQIIGVTGTKGKGTTTMLIAKMCEAAGRNVFVGGNIGLPPLSFLDEVTADDLVVLELSSFQLFDATVSPHIAVCLMVVPEHLNWHRDFAEYAAAKGNIFAHQTAGDLAVYYPRNDTSSQLVALSPGHHVPYLEAPGAIIDGDYVKIDDQTICRTDEIGLLGPHNQQNIAAAITAVWELLDHNTQAIAGVVRDFKGLEHRLELAGVYQGVRYYDDSFATTPETAIAAIQAFAGEKVVILGGADKGASYDELAGVVEDTKVIHALLIGEQAPRLATALDKAGFSHYTVVKWQGMDSLVQTASHLVEPGDVVLLSPGCASFGLFTNYKDRGNQFMAAVHALISKEV
ncbi:UDP-N-acetylmuramoyl-L-alanine--D-glutamate ligase [Candidatus Saccharibacteria bacterium]|nr:UDP-N-acetylmuramoyl-L-alanine--D-glutamate ligase [Candidatus Saccharibacteria bacterium]